jgi:DegV family protein with EDD domain
MANRIILSADSTCDIGPLLQARYDVHFFNYHIQLGDKSYLDRIEISPDELFRAWREDGILPKTAAITPAEYLEFFKPWVDGGCDVIHVNLGSALSSAYQNCVLAAKELGRVYPVDSASLSTGSGHLVVRAGEMIAKGMAAADIQAELVRMRERTSTSFVLDTLEFMAAGGRCSSVTAFGANLLRLKPSIKVDNLDGGRMGVSKKYRGTMEKVLPEYVYDMLHGRDDLETDLIFITHSICPREWIDLTREEIKRYANFGEILDTEASGTISSHCGPGTVGILFMTK